MLPLVTYSLGMARRIVSKDHAGSRSHAGVSEIGGKYTRSWRAPSLARMSSKVVQEKATTSASGDTQRQKVYRP